MALTVVKYRKTGDSTSNTIVQRKTNPIIKIGDGSGLIINKIPASIKPAIKRPAATTQIISESNPNLKAPKYSIQTIASAGTPSTSLEWQPTRSTSVTSKKTPLGTVIGSLPANTIIQSAGANRVSQLSSTSTATASRAVLSNGATVSPVGTMQVRHPTIYIKREPPPRTMRQMTMDLIEKNPKLHIGLDAKRLQVLKNVISAATGVALPDCYLTLRKLRQNEDCALLGELFEVNEAEVHKTIARSVASFARYMRSLLHWPDSKKFYDRHKDLPFEFRQTLSNVQSLIETVETEMRLQPNILEAQSYKFILCITATGVITYVSDAYLGKYDDITIFAAAKFKDVIPKYLSLMVEPGKGIRHKSPTADSKISIKKTNSTDSNTDSADESPEEIMENRSIKNHLSNYAAKRLIGELAADQTLSVIDNKLCSSKVKDFSIPTMRVEQPICRQQIRDTIERMREFKILQDCALKEPVMFHYLNEIIITVAAFSNLLLE